MSRRIFIIASTAMAVALGIALYVRLGYGDRLPAGSSAGSTQPAARASLTQEPEVVLNLDSKAELKKDFATVDQLNGSADASVIVRGEVVGTNDVYTDQLAHRILTVAVQKAYRGRTAKTITVYEDGGIIPVKDVLPDLDTHLGQALSPEQIEHGVVDFRFMGADHSNVGDKVILYLRRNPNSSQGDSYQMVSSVHGRFTLDEASAEYRRPGSDRPGFEASATRLAMEGKLSRLR